ncbi:MAG: hypothetical protein LBE91_15135, partial [Tannerella sp.]|nr:hypothetical protein [Tannerella sp.]
MKIVITFLTMTLLIAAGWIGCKSSDNQHDTIIAVDVTKSYSPKKELILQDFTDVEYIPLETKEKALSGYTVYNGDYSSKQKIYLSGTRPVSQEIDSWYSIEAPRLFESYEKGELKEGKLKEIASTLKEDDNPVIMLIKR